MFPPQPNLCTPWDLTWDDAVGCCEPKGLDSLSDTKQTLYLTTAMEFLWRRTGRQFSVCDTTITTNYATCPTHGGDCTCASMTSWWSGFMSGDVIGYRHRGNRLEMPNLGPIRTIISVTVNGVTLIEGTDFSILNRSTLVKASGQWPRWANIEIHYRYGQDPPQELLDACGILAVNLAQACSGCPCEFPADTKTVSAEGVSISINDPSRYLVGDLSGIARVDKVILALWRHGATSAPGGFDPAAESPWDRITPSDAYTP